MCIQPGSRPLAGGSQTVVGESATLETAAPAVSWVETGVVTYSPVWPHPESSLHARPYQKLTDAGVRCTLGWSAMAGAAQAPAQPSLRQPL